MEAQFQMKRTERETADADLSGSADAPGDVAEDTAEIITIALEQQTPVDGLILPVLPKTGRAPPEDEKKVRHARAESLYGAVPGATEPAEDSESKIDYKA